MKINEAKRAVRRYYIRPQHIWCASKADIIKALIEIDKKGGSCSVYTLNNLGDNNDVTKLTTNDIIYYFDNHRLEDKNHVPVMDYDLYIKHEEKRKKIDAKNVSNDKFIDVYKDRMTDKTIDEALFLTFDAYNAFGEKLQEGKAVNMLCCICGDEIDGYGNNPEPYMSAKDGARCCDACNLHFVIPARLNAINKEE